MFGYAVGLLLPSSEISDQLLDRPEVLQHIADELSLQAASIPETELIVWWICADRRSPSLALTDRLVNIAPRGKPLCTALDPVPIETLEMWMRQSQAMIHLRFPEDPHREAGVQRELLWDRLHSSCVQPGWQTRDLVVDPNGDRLSQQNTYFGSCVEPVAGDNQRLSALQELRQKLTPQPGEHGALDCDPRAWLLARSHRERRHSDQQLVLQATLLSAIVMLVRWITPSLAPSILLLLVGAWWMSRQPRRQRSQEWWCLDQLLWVQDAWRGFGLSDCPADRTHLQRQSSVGEKDFDLTSAVRSHQVWLCMQPQPTLWGRRMLTTFLESLDAFRQEMDDLGRQQRQRRLAVRLLLSLAVVLVVTTIHGHDSRVVEELLLLLVVMIGSFGLATPIPAISRERLIQNRRQLDDDCIDLNRLQQSETLTDPMLRAVAESLVRRIGHEIVDLCDDALLGGRDWRRWLP